MGRKTFEHVKVGDKVTRMLAGKVPMVQEVWKVDDELIHTRVGAVDGWTFDRITGAEIDEELGWGPLPKYDHTGSYLVHPEERN